VGVTLRSLVVSLAPVLVPGPHTARPAPTPLTVFLWAGGDVEKLLCSDRERSLVSFTGLGFFTLS